METSDDDGDPATAQFRLILLCTALLISCNNPHAGKKWFTSVVPEKKNITAKIHTPKTVKPKKKIKKKIYLTFDDGPNRGTRNVLDIVKDEQVPVTFFIVGEHVFASTAQSRLWDSLQMVKHIELCNHSFSHAHNRYSRYHSDPDSVVKDFRHTQDTLRLDNEIVRTPGRNIWRIDSLHFTDLRKSAAAADSLMRSGFIVMGWDVEWHYDHKTMSVTSTAEELMSIIDSAFAHRKTKLPGHLVLLAHDQVYAHSSDSQELRNFLKLLKRRDDYELTIASSYPLVNRKQKDSLEKISAE